MEEYKNLEEIIKLSEEELNNNDDNVSAVLDLVDLKELQNLIARYKEVEEENKRLKIELEIKKYCKVNELTEDLIYYKNLAKEYQGNCIPKSKVKEILDKYKHTEIGDTDKIIEFYKKIQELLED